MTVYKLLSIINSAGDLASFIAIGEHQIQYPKDRAILYPNMFVYESEAKARADIGFANNPRLALWECETENEPRPAPSFILRSRYINQHFNAYWEGERKGLWADWFSSILRRPAPGTLLVDDLKLIRPVA